MLIHTLARLLIKYLWNTISLLEKNETKKGPCVSAFVDLSAFILSLHSACTSLCFVYKA